jgi:hypothetical protein
VVDGVGDVDDPLALGGSALLGQLAFCIEFLKLGGLFDGFVADCPLAYGSPNAPGKGDVLGTTLLSLLAGHRRYAHITSRRGDGVNPQLLGMGRMANREAVRRALQKMANREAVRRALQKIDAAAEIATPARPDQPAVGNRDPAGVARQIGEDSFGSGEGRFGVDHPLDVAQRRRIGADCAALDPVQVIAEEA